MCDFLAEGLAYRRWMLAITESGGEQLDLEMSREAICLMCCVQGGVDERTGIAVPFVH